MIFPSKYKAFDIDGVRVREFKLIPIRYQDRAKIRQWRNEQIYHLRQSNVLSEEEQENYFKNIVAPLFNTTNPKQILFSFLYKNKLVGYGGLVHINWLDRHAEVSFLMDTQLQEEYFAEFWYTYLKMLSFIAFDGLYFQKIFTYAFDIRPHLYPVLLRAGFVEEARLKNHCLIDNTPHDVLIHSKFAPASITYRKARIEDCQLYLDWSNEPLVRSQSFNTATIQYAEHRAWFENKINDDNVLMLLFFVKDQAIGQVRIEHKETENVVSISLSKESRGRGYASRILRLGITQFRKEFREPIHAYIRADNIASIRSFETAGFLVHSEVKINNIPSYKYIFKL